MGIFEPAPPHGRINLGNEPEFDLGPMRVKPAECAVFMNGERGELQPRMMQVLVALSERRPAVVSREQLVERCWDGRIVGDDSLNRCILGLRNLAQQFVPEPFAIETVPRVGYRLSERRPRTRWPIAAGALVAALAIAMLWVLLAQRPVGSSEPPTVSIRAAADDPASQRLARDLVVKLGAAQAQQMRVRADSGSRPGKADLTIEVGPISDSGRDPPHVILADSGQALLWSKEFPGSAAASELEQQIAFTASTVLGCALEAGRLADAVLKTYLDACAEMADSKYDPLRALHMLDNVVRSAPDFTPAWAKLLTAETDAVSNVSLSDATRLRPVLARHIVIARKLQPQLPEAYVAEFILTPPSDYLERGRLLDAAVEHNPAHGGVRAERAIFLESVGRMDDAVQDAVEAIKLDPLSPITRETYIEVLAYAGRVGAAQQALREAERLWPGAASVRVARYAVSLRVGDPAEALRMLRSGAVPTRDLALYTSFLEARIDRSPARIDEAIRQSRSAYRSNPRAIIGYSQSLAEFGRNEEWFGLLQNWRRMDLADDVTDSLFRPAFADLHRDPRFIRVANRLGLVRYWRTTGHWPDFCFTPDLPYDCKTEAAKIGS